MTRSSSDLHELLPFYVNGTLSAEERARVEEALTDDAELRVALEETRRLYTDMRSEPAPRSADTNLARLMRAIDRTPQDAVSTTTDTRPEPRRTNGPILKLALAASLVALLVQGFVFWRGDIGVGLASGNDKGTLTVAFQPDATESEIRALLTELDLQIVSGPSSLGLYRLKGDGSATALQALMSRGNIVESAENAMD